MTEKIKSLLPPLPFHIPAGQAARLAETLGLSSEQLMLELIPVARSFARPPISRFQVGAVTRGRSGALYMGVNLEFPGQSLIQTVHAEQCAVTNAMSHGEKGLEALAVSSAPCGFCRQLLNELAGGGQLMVLIPSHEPIPLAELLPRSFGPGDLGIEAGLLAQTVEPLEVPQEASGLVREAFLAANRSYAPYSKDPAGIALRTADEKVFTGSYAENAAFNPSTSPLHAALIQMVGQGLDFDQITEAVLVEPESAQVSQIGITRLLLEQVAPQAKLTVNLAQR
jgi:cytidine deaminase